MTGRAPRARERRPDVDYTCSLCGNPASQHEKLDNGQRKCPPAIPRGKSKRKRVAREKPVQQAVKDTLEAASFLVSDLSQPRASMQTPGLPDLYAVSKRFKLAIWVEVKAPGGELSRAQRRWHEDARAAGAIVVSVWGVDDMVRELQELGVPIRN